MGKRISTAALLLLFGLAAPRFAAAAVVVAEPTGDAEPAFLAELKASLETVAAEAAADVDAELRASAAFADAVSSLSWSSCCPIGASPISDRVLYPGRSCSPRRRPWRGRRLERARRRSHR
jgi:hypothetical protein